jgi:hypothetical protein
MTFAELKARVYQDCGFNATPSTDVQTRVGAWVNEGYRKLLREPGMVDLRQTEFTFASVTSQTIYAIPQMFESINAIVNQANNLRLRLMSRDVYRSMDPGEVSSGLPYAYIPEGFRTAFRQPPTTGSGIWAVSTSVADTTQTVTIQGTRLSGDQTAAQTATLTGTSRVAVGSFTDLIQIEAWNVSAVCAGSISLYDAVTSGNELARIPIGRTSVLYETIRLWPTPAGVYTFLIDGLMLIPTLTAATDTPIFPESYHDVLADYAKMREYERTGSDRLPVAQQNYLAGAANLRTYIQFPPDFRAIAGSKGARNGWTDLGGWYPADYGWP